MKKSNPLFLAVVFGFLVLQAVSQGTRNNYPTPPAPQDSSTTQKETTNVLRRLDPEKLQRDADELARMSQSIPSDVASVRKGMLPKDVIEKLKQIEKLSKRLRTELNP